MEALDVISTDRPGQVNPWPPILRLIALVAMLFAAAQILLNTPTILGSMSRPSISQSATTGRALILPRWQTIHKLRVALAVLDVLDCTLMIVASLLLLRFQRFWLPVLLAAWAWLWLGIWALGMGVTLFSQGWRGVEYLGLNIMWVGLPVVTILLLREYINTNPVAAPI